MKKRIAGLLLCLVMVLGLLPTTAWADTNDRIEVEVTDSSGTTTTGFDTFSKALAAANAVEAGKTVKLTLLDHCSVGDNLDITRDMTLELNGKRVVLNYYDGYYRLQILNAATVTIQDSGTNGKLEGSLTKAGGSNLTITGGEITSDVFVMDPGTFTVTGGHLTSIINNGVTNISGGTIDTITYRTGSINLSGGIFTKIESETNPGAEIPSNRKVLSFLASGYAYRYYDMNGNPGPNWFTNRDATSVTAQYDQTIRVVEAPITSLEIRKGKDEINGETLTVGYAEQAWRFNAGIERPSSTNRTDISYTYYLGTDQSTLFSDGNKQSDDKVMFQFPTGKPVGTYYVGCLATVYGYPISDIVKVTVIKADQTVTASDVSVTYGDKDKSVSASGYGNVTYAVTSGSDVVDVDSNTGALTIKKVGTATITATAAGDASHNPGSTTINVTVQPRKIKIYQAITEIRGYDGTTEASVDIDFSDDKSMVKLVENTDYTVKADFASKNVGTHTVSGTVTLKNENYCFENNSRTATFTSNEGILEAILTPTVTVTDKEYDGKTTAPASVSFNGLVSGETLTEGTDYSVTADFTDAGVGKGKPVSYTVKLLDTEAAKNYTFAINGSTVRTVTGTTTASIGKATASVTTLPRADALTYSGAAQALVTAGVANGGEMQYRLGENGDWSTTVPSAKDPGTYEVWYRVVGDGNHYDNTPASVSVTIAPKALTITAKPKTITYGDAPANDGVSYDGFVGGEDATVLSGKLEYAYNYTQLGKVGDYSITPSGLSSTNYAITFVPGTLTVSPKNIAEAVITLAPSSFVYDGSEKTQTVTSVTLEGFDNLTCDISGNVQTNAGTHTITATGTGNFTGNATTTFSIAKATPTGKPSYREIFDAFIRISKAELSTSGGTFSVPGTVEWVDENGEPLDVNTFVRSDTAYRWRFHPTDSTNYNDIFGEIVLWHYEEVTLPTPETKPEEPTSLSFRDVDPDDYFYDPVYWAVENGITTGTSRHFFSPYDACTRAQAVTFLWRAAGCPEPESREMPFTDVSKSSYYYDAVLWAVENGITKGTSATTFGPDDTCTRSQIVTFLWRALSEPTGDAETPFTDVTETAYFTQAVLWAVAEKVTTGTSATTFSPDEDCTRAQIVTFLYRALAK